MHKYQEEQERIVSPVGNKSSVDTWMEILDLLHKSILLGIESVIEKEDSKIQADMSRNYQEVKRWSLQGRKWRMH